MGMISYHKVFEQCVNAVGSQVVHVQRLCWVPLSERDPFVGCDDLKTGNLEWNWTDGFQLVRAFFFLFLPFFLLMIRRHD